MNHHTALVSRGAFWVVPLTLGFLLSSGTASAQRKGGDGDSFLPTGDFSQQDKNKLQAMRDGNQAITASDMADKGFLDKAAKFYVYRLTDRKHQFHTFGQPGTAGMNELVKEAVSQIVALDPKRNANQQQNQQVYIKEFGKRMLASINEVLSKPTKPIAKINAARILAQLGETGQEETADAMCTILEDKDQLDAVKLYVLIGLRNLYKALPGGIKDEDRNIRAIKVLIEFLNREPNYDAQNTEQADAFRYVRREAIRALGQTRLPEVAKKRVVMGRPALELLRMVASDGVKPKPSLSERVEAAMALCQLQSKNADKYQPDYAAYFLGRLVVDFAGKFEQERGDESTFDSKWYAWSLEQGLNELKADTKEKNKYLNDAIAHISPILGSIQKKNPPAQLRLSDWLDNNKPKSQSLFKGAMETVVKEPVPAEKPDDKPAEKPAGKPDK